MIFLTFQKVHHKFLFWIKVAKVTIMSIIIGEINSCIIMGIQSMCIEHILRYSTHDLGYGLILESLFVCQNNV